MSLRDRALDALERLVEASAAERALVSLASLVASILVGVVIILVAGRTTTCEQAAFVLANPRPFGAPELFRVGFCYNPVAVFDSLFLGALGDPFEPGWDPLNRQMASTLRETSILVFTGLSVALAFRAGVFNIGTQGQLVVGALATAVSVLWASALVSGLVGTVLLVPFGVIVGAAFGGLYGAIPGALKAYADANEVVTTIMLNFVATGLALYLVQEVFSPGGDASRTAPLPEYALFPPLLFDSRFSFSVLALLFGFVAAGGVYVLLSRTVFGYDLRASGIQPSAAEYGGVDAKRTVVASMTLSGALGGIGGAVYVLMVLGRFQSNVPAYGFDGITVAILAGNNPLGVGFAALLFGVLKSGSSVVDIATNVPPELVGVLRGFIILFVAMPEFFRLLGRRAFPRDRTPGETVAADGGEDAAREEGEER
jgi:simple sugar transport system permease protein